MANERCELGSHFIEVGREAVFGSALAERSERGRPPKTGYRGWAIWGKWLFLLREHIFCNMTLPKAISFGTILLFPKARHSPSRNIQGVRKGPPFSF